MENDYDIKLKLFFDKKIPIHLILNDNKWANGYIKELGSSFIILNEFKFGNMLIFIKDIAKLETFTKEVKE